MQIRWTLIEEVYFIIRKKKIATRTTEDGNLRTCTIRNQRLSLVTGKVPDTRLTNRKGAFQGNNTRVENIYIDLRSLGVNFPFDF